MKYMKYFEDIRVPIKVGDTILGGRFKNKKVLVKKIGKNKKGDITINDKPLLKFRIIKENLEIEDINEYFYGILDEGFKIEYFNKDDSNKTNLRLFKSKEEKFSFRNVEKFKIKHIKNNIIRFLEMSDYEASGFLYITDLERVYKDGTIENLESIDNNLDIDYFILFGKWM